MRSARLCCVGAGAGGKAKMWDSALISLRLITTRSRSETAAVVAAVAMEGAASKLWSRVCIDVQVAGGAELDQTLWCSQAATVSRPAHAVRGHRGRRTQRRSPPAVPRTSRRRPSRGTRQVREVPLNALFPVEQPGTDTNADAVRVRGCSFTMLATGSRSLGSCSAAGRRGLSVIPSASGRPFGGPGCSAGRGR